MNARSIEYVEASIEAAQLTIGISTALLADPWFGERARSHIEERKLELALLESEMNALRARDVPSAQLR